MIKSTTATPRRKPKTKKPAKPRPDFPLFAHATGRWAKKIRGKFAYFGKWSDDPKGTRAMEKWLDEKDELLAGRVPRPKGEPAGVTVKLLCDAYLTHAERKRDAGEIQGQTFDEYFRTAVRITAAFGRERLVSDLTPSDFAGLRVALSRIRRPVGLHNEIQRVRGVFKFGFDDGMLATPIRYGMGFQPPTRKTLRIDRAKKGARDLQADQIRQILDAASVPIKGMALLAINCGFGNNDCATLPFTALDLETGWVSYSRPKTGVSRRAKLWPETVAALNAVIAKRPAPRDEAHAEFVFITCHGAPWSNGPLGGRDSIGAMFRRLLADLGLYRSGIGFYSLRRSFATVASNSLDQIAVDLIMGHSPRHNDMPALYRQRVSDSRLEAVANYVRQWLFSKTPAAE